MKTPDKILFVDDEKDVEFLIRQLLKKQANSGEIEIYFAYDGFHALQVLEQNTDINVIFTDINMPQMDGLTLLKRIKEMNDNKQTVIVTAFGDMNNIRASMNRGAFDFITKPINSSDLEITIAQVCKYVNKRILEKEEKEKLRIELDTSQREIIYQLAEIVEVRSQETGNHVRRVAEYSKILALQYGLPSEEAESIKLASPMHDLGKVGIPDAILLKPGRLTEDEFSVMKTHTTIGYEFLSKSSHKLFQDSAIVAHEHHEKFDGSGYPRGLKGEEIHIFGRITALADVYDALGSDRCYKEAWPENDVIDFLKYQSGKHFDPKLIECFFSCYDQITEVRNQYRDIFQPVSGNTPA